MIISLLFALVAAAQDVKPVFKDGLKPSERHQAAFELMFPDQKLKDFMKVTFASGEKGLILDVSGSGPFGMGSTKKPRFCDVMVYATESLVAGKAHDGFSAVISKSSKDPANSIPENLADFDKSKLTPLGNIIWSRQSISTPRHFEVYKSCKKIATPNIDSAENSRNADKFSAVANFYKSQPHKPSTQATERAQ